MWTGHDQEEEKLLAETHNPKVHNHDIHHVHKREVCWLLVAAGRTCLSPRPEQKLLKSFQQIATWSKLT